MFIVAKFKSTFFGGIKAYILATEIVGAAAYTLSGELRFQLYNLVLELATLAQDFSEALCAITLAALS
ncbi:hypothetical protein [Primorskyibacter sp. S187A]|uniref:hypothetical protein n=1 Tax=Primorskyibacter sp. S187A TaxID=3415130 RepID=UPI003C7D73B7